MTDTTAIERRNTWLLLGVSLLAAVLVIVGLHFGVGVEIDAPTLALAVACIVLIGTLRAMWGVVVALSRPAVESYLGDDQAELAHTNLAELREDKRRILRAIKELEFDHAMGKLSDEDFREVGDRYRLRAIEVLRKLDSGDELHPQLQAHLDALGLKLDQPEPPQQQAAEEAAP